MNVLTLLFLSSLALSVQGSECVCATIDIQATSDQIPFVLHKGACAKITDRITGTDHFIWYYVEYNNKTGWIRYDKAMLTASQCEDSECRDISNVCGAISNVCTNYKFWAYEYCRKTCDQCHVQPTMCVDEEFQCSRYGKSVCKDYTQWAHLKCRNYCGFCGDICLDKEKDCSDYGKIVCTKYTIWAKAHCQKFCDLCHLTDQTTTTTTTTTMVPTTSSASACKDQDGIDCVWLDSTNHVCSEAASASQFCPQYCKVCGTGDALKSVIGR